MKSIAVLLGLILAASVLPSTAGAQVAAPLVGALSCSPSESSAPADDTDRVDIIQGLDYFFDSYAYFASTRFPTFEKLQFMGAFDSSFGKYTILPFFSKSLNARIELVFPKGQVSLRRPITARLMRDKDPSTVGIRLKCHGPGFDLGTQN